MMKSFTLLFLLCQIVSGRGFSQQINCGSANAHKYLMKHNPAYASSFNRQLNEWKNYVQSGSPASQNLTLNTSAGPVYEIPVVFHIIHTGKAIGTRQNPSDATIQSLVSYLNAVYSATWPDNPSANNGGVNIPIRFKLAQRTPDCISTNGINRVDGRVLSDYEEYGIKFPGGDMGADDTLVKALSIWPNTQYLNIWIVTNINGDGESLSGYAYYPGAPANMDGVVLRCDQTELTIAHEVGHSLGLAHTFEGSNNGTTCPVNNNCITDGDYVCDTDPHPLVASCEDGINPCTNTSYVPVMYNIMNYTECRDRFTLGQKARMVFQLLNYRGSLNTSLGAVPPGLYLNNLSSPVEACVPNTFSPPNDYDIGPHNVYLANMKYGSGGYTLDGSSYIDNTINTCLQEQSIAHLVAGRQYTLSVSIGPSNPEDGKVWIDWNNDGSFQASEVVLNYRNVTTTQNITITVPSRGVALCTPLRMRVFSDYSGVVVPTPCSDPVDGQVEDFTVFVTATDNTPSVSISANLGTSFSSGQAVTFTANATNAGANPTYQWRKNGVDIVGETQTTYSTIVDDTTLQSNDEISVLLINTDACVAPNAAISNVLTLNSGTGISSVGKEKQKLSLFPNPNNGSFTIKGNLSDKNLQNVTLEVFNFIGQSVYNGNMPINKGLLDYKIDFSNKLPTGNYLIKINGDHDAIIKFTVTGNN